MSKRALRRARHLWPSRPDHRRFKDLVMIGQIVKAFRMLADR